ncbi:hypothetical protein CGCVW01_v005611 [Colletotrichum viniferum]|nr:hypothetical protein CGCVW01_v005611 [Colletotrichum viniferum]
MAASRESAVVIERRPLDTSPAAPLNSYNHHALAPWVEETGYLTPLFLHRREKEIAPCNMGQWLSPACQRHMQPCCIRQLLSTDCPRRKSLHYSRLLRKRSTTCQRQKRTRDSKSLAGSINANLDGFGKNSSQGYFVRMSHCSPKDADAGTLRPVFTIKDALVLDVYAEVKNPDFVVSLIEINLWGAHAGSESLLFHWLDDANIINSTGSEPEAAVVIRLVEEGETPVLSRDEAY